MYQTEWDNRDEVCQQGEQSSCPWRIWFASSPRIISRIPRGMAQKRWVSRTSNLKLGKEGKPLWKSQNEKRREDKRRNPPRQGENLSLARVWKQEEWMCCSRHKTVKLNFGATGAPTSSPETRVSLNNLAWKTAAGQQLSHKLIFHASG